MSSLHEQIRTPHICICLSEQASAFVIFTFAFVTLYASSNPEAEPSGIGGGMTQYYAIQ